MGARGYAVGLVGATGAVGRMTLALFTERRFPLRDLRVFASPRSVGARLACQGRFLRVRPLRREALKDLDFVFFAVNTAMSREWCPVAARLGAVAIDDSSAWRMEPSVPLVIPEVNGDALRWHRGIVAIPNCAITPVAMVLKPLHRAAIVRRVVMATYQSVSGYGASAVDELEAQVDADRRGRPLKHRVFDHPIAFNVIPHIDDLTGDGSTKEERKFQLELRKILDAPSIRVTGTAVRVPVRVGHSTAVNVQFAYPLTPERARRLLAKTPGVKVVGRMGYPTPREGAGTDPCYVGRIREDRTVPHGLNLWTVMDNLRKGAALNSIHIAEHLIRTGP